MEFLENLSLPLSDIIKLRQDILATFHSGYKSYSSFKVIVSNDTFSIKLSLILYSGSKFSIGNCYNEPQDGRTTKIPIKKVAL